MDKKNKAAKILLLQGSPRKKGNSITLAEQIVEGAESVGATVEKIYLHSQDISPCQACYACHRPDSIGCAIDDRNRTAGEIRKIFERSGGSLGSTNCVAFGCCMSVASV